MIARLNGVPDAAINVHDVTWNHPASRQFGSCSLFVPRRSPIYRLLPVGDDSPIGISLFDDRVGWWYGLGTSDDSDPAGLTISGNTYDSTFAHYHVAAHAPTMYGLSGGAVVEWAFRSALAGRADLGFVAGTFSRGAMVPQFAPRGQSFADVCGEVGDLTGEIYDLDERRRVSWRAPTVPVYPGILADGGDVAWLHTGRNFADRAASVTGRLGDGRTVTRVV